MSFTEYVLWVIGTLHAYLISEIVTDPILIQYGRGRFAFKLNFKRLKPFISHKKAVGIYLIQAFIVIPLFAYILKNLFNYFVLKTISYWVTVIFLSLGSVIWITLKRLGVNPKKVIGWIILLILFYLVSIISFFIINETARNFVINLFSSIS